MNGERRKIEEKVREKIQEIQYLDEKIRDARVYLQALQDVLRMLPREGVAAPSPQETLRTGSLAARARDIIRSSKKPLHIKDIIREMGNPETRKNLTGLGGSLAAYARRQQIFVRTAPNTFGLVELGHDGHSSPVPPSDFGQDDISISTAQGLGS